MKEDFKKWLYELADCPTWKSPTGEIGFSSDALTSLEILIKAMWAINRENENNTIQMDGYCVGVIYDDDRDKTFFYSKYNNFERETLESALQYIFDNTTTEEE